MMPSRGHHHACAVVLMAAGSLCCDTGTLPMLDATLGCSGVVAVGDSCAYEKQGYLCDTVECGNGTVWSPATPGCQVDGQPLGAYIDMDLGVDIADFSGEELSQLVGVTLGDPYVMQRVQSRGVSDGVTRVRVEFYIKVADRTYNQMAADAVEKVKNSVEISQKYNGPPTNIEPNQTPADQIPVTPNGPNSNGGNNGGGNSNSPSDTAPKEDDDSGGFPWIILAIILGLLFLCCFLFLAWRVLKGTQHPPLDPTEADEPLAISNRQQEMTPTPTASASPTSMTGGRASRRPALPPLKPTPLYETGSGDPITPTMTPLGYPTGTPSQRIASILDESSVQLIEDPSVFNRSRRGVAGVDLSASNRSMGSLSMSRNGRDFPRGSPTMRGTREGPKKVSF